MRVLCVTGAYPNAQNPQPGAFIRSQVDSLRARGVEIDICVLSGNGLKKYAMGVGAVRRALAIKPYDLVHAHYMYAGWSARLATGLPLVVSFMGNDVFGDCDNEGSYPWVSVAVHAVLSNALAFSCAHAVVKSKLLGERLHFAEKTVIPNGVDLTVFTPQSPDRSRLGFPKEGFVVLFAGRPTDPVKRWPLAERAVALLAARRPNVHLVHVEGRTQEEMAIAYGSADCLLLTSAHEGSPNVVKEALACELPVVSVDVGDVGERIEGLEGCHLVRAEPASIAFALEQVALHGRRLEGARARAVSLEWAADRVLEIYARVVQSSRGG